MELLALGQAEPEEVIGVGARALVLLRVGDPAGLNVAALRRKDGQNYITICQGALNAERSTSGMEKKPVRSRVWHIV